MDKNHTRQLNKFSPDQKRYNELKTNIPLSHSKYLQLISLPTYFLKKYFDILHSYVPVFSFKFFCLQFLETKIIENAKINAKKYKRSEEEGSRMVQCASE